MLGQNLAPIGAAGVAFGAGAEQHSAEAGEGEKAASRTGCRVGWTGAGDADANSDAGPCRVGLIQVGHGAGAGMAAPRMLSGEALALGRAKGGRERQKTTRSDGRYDAPTKKTQLRTTLLRKERRRCQTNHIGGMRIYARFGFCIVHSRQCDPGSMKQVSGVGVGAGSCVRTMSCGSRIGTK